MYLCFAAPETENYLKYNKDMQTMKGQLEALTHTVNIFSKKSERKIFQIKSLLRSQSHVNDRKSEKEEESIQDNIDNQYNDFNRTTMTNKPDFVPSNDKECPEKESPDTILLNKLAPKGLKSKNLMTSKHHQGMEEVYLKALHKIHKREFEN